MDRGPLGRTGLTVSRLGLGTVSLGMAYGIQRPGEQPTPGFDTAADLVDRAARAGVSYFDTARGYGESESVLARGLQGHPECVVATKAAVNPERGPVGIEASVLESLETLARRSIDLLQIHNATPQVLADEAIQDILLSLKDRGLVDHLGATVYGDKAALAAIEALFIDVVQIPYSPLDRRPEAEIIPIARKRGVGLVARSILLKGVLTPRAQHLPDHLSPLREAARGIATELDVTLADLPGLATRYVLDTPGIDVALVGVSNEAELSTAIEAAGAGPLKQSERAVFEDYTIEDPSLLNPSKWRLYEITERRKRMAKVVAIIQARMGSSRLPGKVLKNVQGRPLLAHQVERVRRSRLVDEIVIATSAGGDDEEIRSLATSLGVHAFAGDEHDVLDRGYRAATEHGADVVVRLTGDCPFTDPEVFDRLVDHYLEGQARLDYVGTGPTYPEGYDVEVVSMDALRQAWAEADSPVDREHVTTYIWGSGRFKVERLQHDPDLAHLRLTVDEPEDLGVIRELFAPLHAKHGYSFTVHDILAQLNENPELADRNAHITRNEGLFRSRAAAAPRAGSQNRSLKRSRALAQRASDLIPAGTQTLSKGPTQFVQGVSPRYVRRAQGCRVWDVDGNEYLDHPMALGAVVLGHGYPAVGKAIAAQLEDGITYSLPHELEVEVSELLRSTIPCAEMVRFGKNGSDVTTGAIRVARAHTGRSHIVHCGYHGWHDWYIGSKPRNRGVPESAIAEQTPFSYNNSDELAVIFEERPDEIAAVIMEPYQASGPEGEFLRDVARITRKNGAVLIFDEVFSGFRFNRGGIHQTLGVEPDIACFGKALGNGMPISALVGKHEVMSELEEVFFSFTFGGEALSLAAAKATLIELEDKPVIEHIGRLGRRFQAQLERIIHDLSLHNRVESLSRPHRPVLRFRDSEDTPEVLQKSVFQQEVVSAGILFNGAHSFSYSHTEAVIDETLAVYQDALGTLAGAQRAKELSAQLKGPVLQPVFRAYS